MNAGVHYSASAILHCSIKGRSKLSEACKHKCLVVNNLRFSADDKLVKLYSFVIMNDHIHFIWQMQPLTHPQYIELDFLKYSAQQIKHDLKK